MGFQGERPPVERMPVPTHARPAPLPAMIMLCHPFWSQAHRSYRNSTNPKPWPPAHTGTVRNGHGFTTSDSEYVVQLTRGNARGFGGRVLPWEPGPAAGSEAVDPEAKK